MRELSIRLAGLLLYQAEKSGREGLKKMLTHVEPNIAGLLVAGIMLSSGLVLGSIYDRVLRLVGVRDRREGR